MDSSLKKHPVVLSAQQQANTLLPLSLSAEEEDTFQSWLYTFKDVARKTIANVDEVAEAHWRMLYVCTAPKGAQEVYDEMFAHAGKCYLEVC